MACFQASYTYSHSIDNISDPMLSDAFNLAATNPDTIGAAHSFGMFTRQFDSRADRGNSDFDIRHNLTLYSVWDLPCRTQQVDERSEVGPPQAWQPSVLVCRTRSSPRW